MKNPFKVVKAEKKKLFPDVNEPESDEAKMSFNIVGELMAMEKFRFVSNKVIAEVVHETVKRISKLMGK